MNPFKLWRTGVGIGPTEAAKQIGCTRQALGQWERGVTIPNAYWWSQIAVVYRLDRKDVVDAVRKLLIDRKERGNAWRKKVVDTA